jgi:hypothetical protein
MTYLITFYLRDTVTGNLFKNAGTWAFTCGTDEWRADYE